MPNALGVDVVYSLLTVFTRIVLLFWMRSFLVAHFFIIFSGAYLFLSLGLCLLALSVCGAFYWLDLRLIGRSTDRQSTNCAMAPKHK